MNNACFSSSKVLWEEIPFTVETTVFIVGVKCDSISFVYQAKTLQRARTRNSEADPDSSASRSLVGSLCSCCDSRGLAPQLQIQDVLPDRTEGGEALADSEIDMTSQHLCQEAWINAIWHGELPDV